MTESRSLSETKEACKARRDQMMKANKLHKKAGTFLYGPGIVD